MVVFNSSFFHRNPRYTILLGVFLACSLLLLVPWHSTPIPAMTNKLYDYLPTPSRFRGMSLEEFVAQEENHYAQILKDREAMIKHYGPTPDKINSFPPGDIFYVLWDFYIAGFNCPHRISRLGNLGDGGKWICGVERLATQHSPCVIYSLGVNKDSSFEANLLQKAPNCEIFGYDFSVPSFGPQTENNATLKEKTHFFPYLIGGEDKPYNTPPEYSIKTLMEKNGHTFIDILKIDIEGGEFVALESFFRHYVDPNGPVLPIGQMEIEIHAWSTEGQFSWFNRWWTMFERAGLRPFWTEPNLPYVSHLRTRPDLAEYSFINAKGRHSLITDNY